MGVRSPDKGGREASRGGCLWARLGGRCGRELPTEEGKGQGAEDGDDRDIAPLPPNHHHWVNSGRVERGRCARGTKQVTMEGGGMEGATQSPTSILHLRGLVSNFRKDLFCKLELKRGHLLGLGRVSPGVTGWLRPLPWAVAGPAELEPCRRVSPLPQALPWLAPVPSATTDQERTPPPSRNPGPQSPAPLCSQPQDLGSRFRKQEGRDTTLFPQRLKSTAEA